MTRRNSGWAMTLSTDLVLTYIVLSYKPVCSTCCVNLVGTFYIYTLAPPHLTVANICARMHAFFCNVFTNFFFFNIAYLRAFSVGSFNFSKWDGAHCTSPSFPLNHKSSFKESCKKSRWRKCWDRINRYPQKTSQPWFLPAQSWKGVFLDEEPAPVDSLPINLSIQVFVFNLHKKDWIMSTYIKFLCKCMKIWTNKRHLK